MKVYQTDSGIFRERIYFERAEMERICEDALESVGLMPSSPEPVRIERFIEKFFGVSPEYLDVEEGVLGFTEFAAARVNRIVVNNVLDADGSLTAERRIYSTLAHEAGHGLFHARLFVEKAPSLFPEEETDGNNRILCREELNEMIVNGRNRYDGSWWEYQANCAIGALLVPRPLAETVLEPFVSDAGLISKTVLDDRWAVAVHSLSDTFNVNPAAAKIRLNEIFPAESAHQMNI